MCFTVLLFFNIRALIAELRVGVGACAIDDVGNNDGLGADLRNERLQSTTQSTEAEMQPISKDNKGCKKESKPCAWPSDFNFKFLHAMNETIKNITNNS